MNYYGPRQREKDKKWDYTCRNDDYIYPVGYCRPYKEPDPKTEPWWHENSIKKYQAQKDKHHGDGHNSSEEACACYRRYLLDTTLYLDGHFGDTWHKCVVCGELTDGYAQVDNGSMYNLCDTHRTKETVETLFGDVGEIWSSC